MTNQYINIYNGPQKPNLLQLKLKATRGNSEHTALQQLQYASVLLFLLLQRSLHLCEPSQCYSYSVHASYKAHNCTKYMTSITSNTSSCS